MESGDVLDDQGVPSGRVAEAFRGDAPHLHLADAVLRRYPLAAYPPVPLPLPPGQSLLRLPLHRRAQRRPLIARVSIRRHVGRHYRPRPVVDLLVMHLPRGRRRHRRDPQPPLLFLLGLAPARLLPLAHHHDLVLQRVPLLLARVVAPLPLPRPTPGPL